MFRSRERSNQSRSILAALTGGGVLLALALAVASPGGGAEPPRSFLAYDGHSWRGLTEGEKMALLTGFLIGGAFENGIGLSPGQDVLPPEALEKMRRQSRLRFSFTPAVYKARLEDFYFYQDRLSVPLYRALFLINEQIRQDSSGGR